MNPEPIAVPTHEPLRLANASSMSSAYLFMVDDVPLHRKLGIDKVFNTATPGAALSSPDRTDLQLAAGEQCRPWDLGKDFEQSAVMSPIHPATEVGHLAQGPIELKVNGQTRQSSNLNLLIHGVPALIAHLSGFYELQPGDLIHTGTPEGVGAVEPGDRIEGWIEDLGTISLTIGAAR